MKAAIEKPDGFVNTLQGETSQFKVETDPLIMQRLSDNVYNNPIRAVVRELSTNAYDAHVDAGKADVPFDVHLPTNAESYFSIRDYGTGLSKDQLFNIYTTYAKSNRRDSNNYVGSIGIGSKSPFAVVSQFEITSYHKGKKIYGLCFKDETQVPSLTILSEEDTDEPDGFLVKINISKQINHYEEEAKFVYQFFHTKPKLNVSLDYSQCLLDNILFEDSNFIWATTYTQTNGNYYTRKSLNQTYVLMGQVLYEVPSSIIRDRPCVFKAKIGEVDINISRESIQKNVKNTEFIQKKWNSIQLGLQRLITQKINKIPEKYKAYNEYHKLARRTDLPSLDIYYKEEKVQSILQIPQEAQTATFNHYGNRSRTNRLASDTIANSKVFYQDTKAINLTCARAYLSSLNLSQGIYLPADSDVSSFCDATGYSADDIIRLSSLSHLKPKRTRSTSAKYYKFGLIRTVSSFSTPWRGVELNEINFTGKNHENETQKVVLVQLENMKPQSKYISTKEDLRALSLALAWFDKENSDTHVSLIGCTKTRMTEPLRRGAIGLDFFIENYLKDYANCICTDHNIFELQVKYNMYTSLYKILPKELRPLLFSDEQGQKIVEMGRFTSSFYGLWSRICDKEKVESNIKELKESMERAQKNYDNDVRLQIFSNPHKIKNNLHLLFPELVKQKPQAATKEYKF